MRTLEQILKCETMDQSMGAQAPEDAVYMVLRCKGNYTEKFHSSNTVGGFYVPTDNVEWTTGFWTGAVWLAYEHLADSGSMTACRRELV